MERTKTGKRQRIALPEAGKAAEGSELPLDEPTPLSRMPSSEAGSS